MLLEFQSLSITAKLKNQGDISYLQFFRGHLNGWSDGWMTESDITFAYVKAYKQAGPR